MTKVTTPSQLKAELESQKTYLLEACLMAFNQLPNQRTKGAFPSTYALAAKIDHLLGGVSGNPRKFRHSALWNFLGGWSAA
ncbi:TPA: hypothetical protein ACTYKX_005119 [Enterobacter asburiae]